MNDGTTTYGRHRGRSLPVWPGLFGQLRASPFIPFYEDRIGPNASFSVYSGHMSPGYLDEDVEAEYWHLRRQATLFDVPEHAIEFVGPDAARFLDRLMPRRIAPMKVGRCCYGIMCYADGGILMDGVLVRLAEDRFRYVLADGEIFGWLRPTSRVSTSKLSTPRTGFCRSRGHVPSRCWRPCATAVRPIPSPISARPGSQWRASSCSRPAPAGQLRWGSRSTCPRTPIMERCGAT